MGPTYSGLALRDLVMRLWLDSMDKVGKLHAILDEENRDVISR